MIKENTKLYGESQIEDKLVMTMYGSVGDETYMNTTIDNPDLYMKHMSEVFEDLQAFSVKFNTIKEQYESESESAAHR